MSERPGLSDLLRQAADLNDDGLLVRLEGNFDAEHPENFGWSVTAGAMPS